MIRVLAHRADYNDGVDREIPIIVPHSDHGDPECCGCLFPVIRGEPADIVCNECDVVILTVRATEAQSVLLEMASAEICTETCPSCGALNVFPVSPRWKRSPADIAARARWFSVGAVNGGGCR